MTPNPILRAEELLMHLDDPDWKIVDARFYLSEPQRGEQEYLNAHLPVAYYVNLDHDMSSEKTVMSGRHPWPTLEQFFRVVQRFGITSASRVIVYDASDGAMASRFWLLMNWIGFEKCSVLDGGYAHWAKQNYALTGEFPKAVPSVIPEPVNLASGLLVSTPEVENMIGSSKFLLMDARSPDRFRGENETIDSVAGHIPGAKNRYYMDNLTSESLFKSPAQLRNEFIPLITPYQPDHIVCYCGSGVTACHNILAMRIAQLPFPRLYSGAWSEWIRNPAHPIQIGE